MKIPAHVRENARDSYRAWKTWVRKRPRLSLLFHGLACLFMWAWAFVLSVQIGLWGSIPSVSELQSLDRPVASEIWSADGVLLGKYYLLNRSKVRLEEVPRSFVEALIATEDARFYHHDGVDNRSLTRVIFKSLLLRQREEGGGSTLHQQLAKNLYPRKRFGLLSLPVNKTREIIIARRLDRAFSKNEILLMYLNTVSFGENTFGLEVASKRFFSKEPLELNPQESALLAGLLKAPSAFNPRRFPERALERRNLVFRRMAAAGFLRDAESDSLAALPLELHYQKTDHHLGLAPYFREHLRSRLTDMISGYKRPDGSRYNLYTDGLKIYTTLDSRMQRYAEQSVNEHMRKLQGQFDRHWQYKNKRKAFAQLIKREARNSPAYRRLKASGISAEEIDKIFDTPVPVRVFDWDGENERELSPYDSILHQAMILHAGFLALDPFTGEIKAWVGGIDHSYFQYDHVLSRRQPGSAFKPVVYAAALEQGLSPCDYIPNDKAVFANYENWSPKNVDEEYGGEYSMEGALAHSVNVVAARLIMKIGPAKVVDLAHRLGVEGDLPAVPSLALGTGEVSLQELSEIYAAFTNGGYLTPTTAIRRIETADGQTLFAQEPAGGIERVMSGEAAALIRQMLQSVVNKGTAAGLRSRYGLSIDIAGKTGTTQSQADGWFMGATPILVAGAWVGARDPSVHFRSLAMGQGARTALPIYGRFMQLLLKDPDFKSMRKAKFPVPTREMAEKLDCEAFLFPFSMTEFKAWYEAHRAELDSTDTEQIQFYKP